MINVKYLFISIVFLLCSCDSREYYLMPKWDFGVEIPLSVKQYYDSDTVAAWDFQYERTTVLKVTPMEFKKYVGIFKFQKVDTVYEGVKIKLELDNNMLRINYYFRQPIDYNKGTDAQSTFSKRKLKYDFDFTDAYIYIDDQMINRVILYNPKDSILIFSASDHEYKYKK